MTSRYVWDIDSFLSSRFALVMLNTPIECEERLLRLWSAASFRVTVDGGTNHWHEVAKRNNLIQSQNPDLITGDFDSIGESVLSHYKQVAGCRLVPTPDQDFTDFTKSLQELAGLCKSGSLSIDVVVAFSENNGRLDQILANVETLFHSTNILDCPVILLSSSTVSWLLPAGINVITVPRSHSSLQSTHIGLIPIGQPMSGVVTKGLKWDLDGSRELAFGKLVSTSNAFAENSVSVEVTNSLPLLWTMDFKQSN